MPVARKHDLCEGGFIFALEYNVVSARNDNDGIQHCLWNGIAAAGVEQLRKSLIVFLSVCYHPSFAQVPVFNE